MFTMYASYTAYSTTVGMLLFTVIIVVTGTFVTVMKNF